MNLLDLDSSKITNYFNALIGSSHWKYLYLNDKGDFSQLNHHHEHKFSKQEIIDCYNTHKKLHEEKDNYYYLDITNNYNFENVKEFDKFFKIRSRDSIISNEKYKQEVINDPSLKVDTIIILRKKYPDNETKVLLNNKKISYKYENIDFCINKCEGNCLGDIYYYKFGKHEELTKFLSTVQLNIKTITMLEKNDKNIYTFINNGIIGSNNKNNKINE